MGSEDFNYVFWWTSLQEVGINLDNWTETQLRLAKVLPGNEDHLHARSLTVENLFLVEPKLPWSLGKIHRRNSSTLIQGSLFCLTEPKSGCASLNTSQAGHVASNYGNKPIKITHLFLGAGQHSLDRKVLEGRTTAKHGSQMLWHSFPHSGRPLTSRNCVYPSSCQGSLSLSSGMSQAPIPHKIVCSPTRSAVLEIQNFKPETNLGKERITVLCIPERQKLSKFLFVKAFYKP